MNERIEQLAVQAGLLYKQFGPTVETRYMKKKEQDLEKFAELIVRECAEVGAYHGGNVRYLILNNFGLKQ
jgi:hypothetical protein